MQEKLVELISTKGFTREGGTTSIPAEVRVMVASSIELSNAVAEGTFLEDLLKIFEKGLIKLPPLGERREDIPELVNYFVEKTKAEVGREMAGVSDAAMEALSTYHWPGNVRELANVIEGAVSTGRGDTVEPADLGLAVREVLSGPGAGQWTTCSGPYEKQIKEARRHIVMAALREAEGETTKAAEALEIDAATLDDMLGELGIRR
jgi:DNA-binding NtrC family response regulator